LLFSFLEAIIVFGGNARKQETPFFSTTLYTKLQESKMVTPSKITKLQFHLIFIVYYCAFQAREQQRARLRNTIFLLHCTVYCLRRQMFFPEDLGIHART